MTAVDVAPIGTAQRQPRRWQPGIAVLIAALLFGVALPLVGVIAQQARLIGEARVATEALRIEAAAAAFRSIYRVMVTNDLDRLSDLALRLPPPGDDGACQAALARAIAFQPHHGHLLRIDAEGRTVCSATEGERRASVQDRAFFRRAPEATGPFLSEMLFEQVSARPVQNVVVPMRTPDGTFDGALVAGIRLDWFADSVRRSPFLDRPQRLSVTVLDRLGRIDYQALGPPGDAEALRQAARTMADAGKIRDLYRAEADAGRARLYALTELDAANGIVLAIGLPTQSGFAGAAALAPLTLLSPALAALLLLVAALGVVHLALVAPLRRLAKDTAALAADGAHPRPAPNGPAEVVTLGQAVDALATALAQTAESRDRTRADLAQTERELRAFTFSASDGLRAPLEEIEAALTKLAQAPTAGEVVSADPLRDAQNAARRIRRQMRDTRLFAEVMHDDRRVDLPKPIDLGELLRDLWDSLGPAVTAKKATLKVEPLPRLIVQTTMIEELFRALLANALAYSKPDLPPEIRVRQGARATTDWIVIDVADNGMGIDPVDHARIFQPFRRLDQDPGDPSTGIGLLLCSRIAERHGGHLSVTSTLGAGATFHLHLPAARVVSQEARSAVSRVPLTPQGLGSKESRSS
ncbi:MAG: ATP-binding protein [Pseudomonadota bacterium]